MKKVIAVLGGGNGAHTLAGDLAIRGYHVRMYEDKAFIGKLQVLWETLTIHCTGLFQGDGKIDLLTDDISEAIDGADYIAVVTPSTAHRAMAEALKGKVKKDQHILIYPGGFGALEFREVLGEECPVILETNNLPYDTRLTGPASIRCFGMSPVSIALFPADADRGFLEDVADISPYDKIYEDVLESDLSLVNPSVHSGPCLLNFGAIEQQDLRGKFCMYEHFTFGAAKVDWAVDAERKAVGEALGYKICSLEDFCEPKKELRWEDIYQKMHGAPELTPIIGPDSIWNRYLTEDCPNGLVPWSELGRHLGVPTPVMDGIISIYSVAHGVDWRAKGIDLARMGLEGMNAEQIRSFLKTGKK